jgi:peptide/nickel transport system permease protein
VHVFLRRLLDALLLLWLVTTLTFALIHLAPGDPATLLIAPSATAAEAARVRAQLGLDAPILLQYARWMTALLQGDLGQSLAQGRPVLALIAEALPISLFLGGVSLLLSFVIGTVIGLMQAIGLRRGATDSLITIVLTAAYATPSFWLALALIAVFTSGAAWLGLPDWLRLPAFGMRSPSANGDAIEWMDRWRHAVLPLVVLTVPGLAGVARYARSALRETVGSPFVVAATGRGLPTSTLIWRYLLQPAVAPLVVLFGLTLPGILAGSVFAEQIFAWPGLGRLMLSAIASRDYPVVLALTVVYATAVIMSNLLADLLLPWLDPRRRDAVA